MAFIILSQLSRECGIFLSTELPGFAKWVPLSLHILKQGIHVCGGGWSMVNSSHSGCVLLCCTQGRRRGIPVFVKISQYRPAKW